MPTYRVFYTVSVTFEIDLDRDTPEDAQSDVAAWIDEDVRGIMDESYLNSVNSVDIQVDNNDTPSGSLFGPSSISGFETYSNAVIFAHMTGGISKSFESVAGSAYQPVIFTRSLTDEDLMYEHPTGGVIIQEGVIGCLSPLVLLETPAMSVVIVPISNDYWLHIYVPADSFEIMRDEQG